MKKVFGALFIVALFVACQPSVKFKTISVDEFSDLIVQDDVLLLDVRSLEEFEESHIDGALFLDVVDSLFNEKALVLDKNKKIAVYCRTGKRSKTASDKLLKLGYKNVYDLDGGITSWKEHGRAVSE